MKKCFIFIFVLIILMVGNVVSAVTLPGYRIEQYIPHDGDNPAVDKRLIDEIYFEKNIDCSGDDVIYSEDFYAIGGKVKSWVTSKRVTSPWGYSTSYALHIGSEDVMYAPSNCSYLFAGSRASLIVLTNFDTSETTNMRSMFEDCYDLANIKWNTDTVAENVTDMRGMFKNCRSLSSLYIPNTSNKCTSMTQMFYGCNNLTYITAHFNTSNCTEMSGMFENCFSLKTLPIGINTRKAVMMSEMFSNCISLESVPTIYTDSAEDMFGMFRNCSSLSTIKFADNNDISNVDSIEYMFSGCRSLKELDLSGFTSTKSEYAFNLFEDCINLETIDLSNFDMSNITDTFAMFENCRNLKTLKIKNFNDINNMEYVSFMFENCENLSSIIITDKFESDNVYVFWNDDSNLETIPTLYVVDKESEELLEANEDYMAKFGADKIKVYDPNAQEVEPVFGDMDGDGVITITDVRLLLQMFIDGQ